MEELLIGACISNCRPCFEDTATACLTAGPGAPVSLDLLLARMRDKEARMTSIKEQEVTRSVALQSECTTALSKGDLKSLVNNAVQKATANFVKKGNDKPPKGGKGGNNPLKCFNCGKLGHKSFQCRSRPKGGKGGGK